MIDVSHEAETKLSCVLAWRYLGYMRVYKDGIACALILWSTLSLIPRPEIPIPKALGSNPEAPNP